MTTEELRKGLKHIKVFNVQSELYCFMPPCNPIKGKIIDRWETNLLNGHEIRELKKKHLKEAHGID